MSLKKLVKIEERFQRSIRIDQDLKSFDALKGFVCPHSSSLVLLSMVRQIKATGQCAFTWTGPYGSGKSSLLVALASILSGNPAVQKQARDIFGDTVADEILSSLPPNIDGWKILPIVGRRDEPTTVLGEVLLEKELLPQKESWNDSEIINTLLSTAQNDKNGGGLIVFIDEMGKILEGAAAKNTDIYFFQQLAETASRSNNRLIVIGVLHQAFGEYAHQLSREMRDEWSKIQGRFVDLPINVAGEEQIDLLSRAIVSKHKPKSTTQTAQKIANIIRDNKPGTTEGIEKLLDSCWPLHPLVACLLGPISKRRFGQNQRSLFGFLNSAEPSAFKDFLDYSTKNDLYTTDYLWDYLRLNLEPTILTSPDAHRWSLAAEAIERCESLTGEGLHLSLLKAIALIDLFKAGSGLVASADLLDATFNNQASEEILIALEQLKKWSLVIFKKHLGAYAVFAGSDFDIESAISSVRDDIGEIDFSELKSLIGLQPILAKRHYHKTGTLRWFDVDIVPLNKVVDIAQAFTPQNGSIGQFILAIPTEKEEQKLAGETCHFAANQSSNWDVVVGLSNQSEIIHHLAQEMLALKKVYDDSPELAGDSVARREIHASLADLQGRLEAELNKAFDQAQWHLKGKLPTQYTRKDLSILASELADHYFKSSPTIHNELLNRQKPSSNAIAAQNSLLRAMVEGEHHKCLGISGFPPERGLYATILDRSRLHTNGSFQSPDPEHNDPCNLAPAWSAATEFLKDNSHRAVSIDEIYKVWERPPYGIKDGLKPVLAVAYILSQRKILAFYRDGIFQSRLRDIDVEVLAKKPGDIQLRYMDLSEVSKNLLSGMADIVRELDDKNILRHLEPIDVARGLISTYDNIHPWAQRTMHLSKEAIRIRNLFKKANDPNQFLFNDIPGLLGLTTDITDRESILNIIDFVKEGLKELKLAYPVEINRIRELLLSELQIHNLSPQSLEELRQRAENIKDISGDFRLEAFVVRLANFQGSDADIEGLASLASNKPSRLWIDNDIDLAKVELADLSQKFLRMEAFARVKGRKDKRHSLAVVVNMNGRPTPLHDNINVSDSDRDKIDKLIWELEGIINGDSYTEKNIILAALVEMCARHIQNNPSLKDSKEAI